jgi:hypothetical protein
MSESKNFYIRDRKLKGMLPVFAFVAASIFLFSLFDALVAARSNPEAFFTAYYLAIFCIFGMSFVFGKIASIEKHRESMDAGSILLRDGRPPILYLRDFTFDEENRRLDHLASIATKYGPFAVGAKYFGLPLSFEERIMIVADQIGPFVALSQPFVRPDAFGAARFKEMGEEWRRSVSELIEKSELLILRTGVGDGLFWEIGEIKRLGKLDRLVLQIEFYADDNSRLRRARYKKFASKLRIEFGIELPPSSRSSKFVYTPTEDNAEVLSATSRSPIGVFRALGYPVEKSKIRTFVKASINGASNLMRPSSRSNYESRSNFAANLLFFLVSILLSCGFSVAITLILLNVFTGSRVFLVVGFLFSWVVCCVIGAAIGRIGRVLDVAGSWRYIVCGTLCLIAFWWVQIQIAFNFSTGVFSLITWIEYFHFMTQEANSSLVNSTAAWALICLFIPFTAWGFGFSKSERSILRLWKLHNK